MSNHLSAMSLEAIANASPSPIRVIRFPAPLDDETLVWLGANNHGLGFTQTAEGELIVTPPTGSLGNRGEVLLLNQFVNWNERTHFGEVRGLTGGVHLPLGGDFDPDVFVVTQADFEEIPDADINKGFLPTLPITVVELLSEANLTATGYTKEFDLKLKAYRNNAVPLVLLINPKIQTTFVRRPNQDETSKVDGLLSFVELPGLVLEVAPLYRACNQR